MLITQRNDRISLFCKNPPDWKENQRALGCVCCCGFTPGLGSVSAAAGVSQLHQAGTGMNPPPCLTMMDAEVSSIFKLVCVALLLPPD